MNSFIVLVSLCPCGVLMTSNVNGEVISTKAGHLFTEQEIILSEGWE